MGIGAKVKDNGRESKSAMCYLWMGILWKIFSMESSLTDSIHRWKQLRRRVQ